MKKEDKITWKPIVKINNLEVKPQKIDLKKFNNYAIYISNDFQTMCCCPALISKPVKTHCYGIMPSTTNSTFNCCIGDYDAVCVDILIYTPYCSYDKTHYYFHPTDIWTDVKNVYTKKVNINLVNRVVKNDDGYHCYFYKKDDAIRKILDARDSYIKDLEIRMKLAASEDTIKIALSAVKELKNAGNQNLQ